MPLAGIRPHERCFRQLMAFGGELHPLTPRVRRNVEPRHVKRHQAEPVMVQVARRRARTTIAHSAEVVLCLVRADRYFVAHAGNRWIYIEDCPVAECALGHRDHRQSKRSFSCRLARHSRRVVAARPRLRAYRVLVYGHWVERPQSLAGKPCILRWRANIRLLERWQRQLLAHGRGPLNGHAAFPIAALGGPGDEAAFHKRCLRSSLPV